MATRQDPRAKASGFARKLRAYLEQGRLIRNAERLSEWLTENGEPVTSGPVGDWLKGKTLPKARYIGLIEQLMGCSWRYLDRADTEWPREWNREAVADLLALYSDAEVETFEQFAERSRQPRPGGATRE